MTHGSLEEHPVFSPHGALDIFLSKRVHALSTRHASESIKLGIVYNADQTAEKGT